METKPFTKLAEKLAKGEVQLSKNGIISLNILVLIENGIKPNEAVDIVIGKGTYEGIAGDVFEALRALD